MQWRHRLLRPALNRRPQLLDCSLPKQKPPGLPLLSQKLLKLPRPRLELKPLELQQLRQKPLLHSSLLKLRLLEFPLLLPNPPGLQPPKRKLLRSLRLRLRLRLPELRPPRLRKKPRKSPLRRRSLSRPPPPLKRPRPWQMLPELPPKQNL